MSDRKWTDAQRKAIDHRRGNLLLSAAAGSGKTATLTQRIIELIENDGADLDRMLIVTYTKAAAEELRSRLSQALSETAAKNPDNRHIVRQIAALESAQISTMHSFFNSELKPCAAGLGLPPDYRTLDSSEAAVLLADTMARCTSEYFDKSGEEGKSFKRLADCISGATCEDGLDKALLSIREDLHNRGITNTQLRENADRTEISVKEPFNTGYYDGVLKRMRTVSRCFSQRFDAITEALKNTENPGGDIEVSAVCAEDAKRMETAADAGYCASYEFFTAPRLPDMSRKKQSDDAVGFHEELSVLKSSYTAEKKKLADCFAPPEDAELICLENAERCHTLADVLDCFEKLYGEAKRERGAIDFYDMEQLALKIFVSPDGTPTEQAKAAGEKFDYIFIDEYQDTNETQDKIFGAVAACTSRFMVGDVKQSIYGFRGACPDIFTDYRRRWAAGDGGDAVFMSNNFRCGEGIIDFSNLVSRYIFSSGATPFDKEDELVFSKNSSDDTSSPYRPAQVCLVAKTDDCDAENYEAQYVASRISALLSGETLDDGTPIRPKDIAILLRSGTKAEQYARALAERGIPVSNEISENFFAYGEVMLIICLLRSIDNPLRDIFLAGAMKSPLFGFSLEELVRIKSHAGDMSLWYAVRDYISDGDSTKLCLKCSDFVRKLEDWRSVSREVYADEMLRTVINGTGLRKYRGDRDRTPADIARSVKIMEDHAAAVAKRGGGLHELVQYLEALTDEKDIPGAVSYDSVRMMTIHHSKGLEFPVCFLSECSSAVNRRRSSGTVEISDGNVAFRLFDRSGSELSQTPLTNALALGAQLSDVEEEARVLYVAMTRARERLIVTAKSKDPDRDMESAMKRALTPFSEYDIITASNTARWMLDAIMREPDSHCYDIEKVIWDNSGVPAAHAVLNTVNEERENRFSDYFKNCLDFTYEKDYLSNIPAKLTVSKLAPDVLDAADRSSLEASHNCAIDMPDEPPMPRFLSKEKHTAAEAGTATHIFMQFCNWQRLFDNGAAAELERLTADGFISADNASLVRLDEIESFRNSDLFGRLLSARRVLREKRFNAVLDAALFTTDPTLAKRLSSDGVKITVQGVVDCMFTDADGKNILVDYKTDRLSKAELSDRRAAAEKLTKRHARQLLLYRDICRDMIGADFDEVYIYSLVLGDVIPVK